MAIAMTRTNRFAIAYLVTMALYGLVESYMGNSLAPGKGMLGVLVSFGLNFLVFFWYHRDSTQRRYRRGALMNIGMIGFSMLALPIYLYRSRKKDGTRIQVLKKFFILAVLAVAASVVGTFAGGALGALVR
jgi:hypothetical protein